MYIEDLLEEWLRGCCTCRGISGGEHKEECPARTITQGELNRLANIVDDYVDVAIDVAIEDFAEELKEKRDEVRVQHEDDHPARPGDGA